MKKLIKRIMEIALTIIAFIVALAMVGFGAVAMLTFAGIGVVVGGMVYLYAKLDEESEAEAEVEIQAEATPA